MKLEFDKKFIEEDLFGWLFFGFKVIMCLLCILVTINGAYYLSILATNEEAKNLTYCPHCRRKIIRK